MAKNKKPKKKYRPPLHGTGTPIVFRWAISPGGQAYLDTAPWEAFALLKAQEATDASLGTLTSAIRLGEKLVRTVADIADEARAAAIPVADQARAAIDSVTERRNRIGRAGATGGELNSLCSGIELLDQLVKIGTRREHRDALRVVLDEAKAEEKRSATESEESGNPKTMLTASA